MRQVQWILLIAMILPAIGCGGFEASRGGGSNDGSSLLAKPFATCDRKDVMAFSLCSEAVGAEYNEVGYLSILRSSCESTGGIFSTSNCDRLSSLGTCVIEAGQSNETHVTYYEPTYSAASAQAACEANSNARYMARQ